MSEHHGLPAENVMRMRRGGEKFPDIRQKGLREMDKNRNKDMNKGKPGHSNGKSGKGQHEKGKGPNR
jgi:hypothetical protein